MLNSGLLKICDRISLFRFSICVSEVGTICKEGGNRVFERSFSEVCIKRNYRLFDGWVYEWMDGWVDRYVAGWMNGVDDRWVCGWMALWVSSWINEEISLQLLGLYFKTLASH